MSLIEALMVAAVSGGASGLVSWGAMRIEMQFLRRDVDHAHRRLDGVGAPEVWRRSKDCG